MERMRKLRQVRWVPLIFLLLLFFIITGVFTGLTATNTVSNSNAGEVIGAVDPNQLKPSECNGINIQNLVVLNNGDNPTNQNDLILGTIGQDIINGGNGDDCIIGGGGDDMLCIWVFCFWGLSGGNGNDVILGGPGNDALFGNAGTDICYGQGGTDNINCETANQ